MSTVQPTVRFHEAAGGPERLRLENRPTPEPGSGEVRVRLEAMSWNRADFLWLANLCRDSLRYLHNFLAALVVIALLLGCAEQATAQVAAETFAKPELVRPFRVEINQKRIDA